jgi:shikimate dehydrogenase
MRVDAAGMASAVDAIRAGELDGANVTMPHKQLAARLADRVEAGARRVGAVNTLVRVGQSVVGHNTDVPGIRAVWEAASLPGSGPVLVLGNGGAAAAALVALEGRDLHLASRRQRAAGELAGAVGVRAAEHRFGRPIPGATIVNATPLGMGGEPLPAGLLDEAAALFDFAYGAATTPAVRSAQERRIPCADGRELLLAQAAESFRLWTGHEMDLAAVRRALAKQ